MSWLRRIRSWLTPASHQPVQAHTGVRFPCESSEVWRLRMQRAAQQRALDELWEEAKQRKRDKAEVIAFHGRRD
jgi:hypothetical protein